MARELMAGASRILQVICRFFEARHITQQPVVVAVSGGADSVALLRLLADLRKPLGLQLIVAHFDHQLRPASAEDAAWVMELATALGVPCVVGQASTAAPATGIEAWARRERYSFLLQVAMSHDTRWVAVAHTADDQAETVLHHVVRGTGLRGLAGMPSVRRLENGVRLMRPCLNARRFELREYLASIGQEFRHDPTNEDTRWTRNEIRGDLIPSLQERFNPRVIESLLSLSQQAQDATRIVQRKAAGLLRRATVEATPGSVRLNITPFVKADPAVVREAAVRLWRQQNWPRQKMAYRHWSALAAMFQNAGPAAIECPGGVAGTRRGTLVRLERLESSGSQVP